MPYRVKDDLTGHEYTTPVVYEGQTKLDKPALSGSGEWLPCKPNVNPRQQAPVEATPATTEAKEATA